jgi:acyl carrier protein
MIIGSLTPSEQATAIKEAFATSDVRTLIANHLGISVGRVTDEAHFSNDLGADWLDRLELMMAVEDQFAGVEITDEDVDHIAVVGDLIRHIEVLDNERRRRDVAPVVRNLFGPRLARAVKSTKQQKGCEEAALFFLRVAGDAMCNLIGWCPETRRRLIFSFTLTTRPCSASGPTWYAFSVRTVELNMRQRWSGLPRGHSRLNVLKRSARGMGATYAALKGSSCDAMLNVRGRNVCDAGSARRHHLGPRLRAPHAGVFGVR